VSGDYKTVSRIVPFATTDRNGRFRTELTEDIDDTASSIFHEDQTSNTKLAGGLQIDLA